MDHIDHISSLVGTNVPLSGLGFQGTEETKNSTKAHDNEAGQKIESNEQAEGLGTQVDAKV